MQDENTFAPAPKLLGDQGEAMVTWYMEKYKAVRDTAITWLVTFAEGNGHPDAELLEAFPSLGEARSADSGT